MGAGVWLSPLGVWASRGGSWETLLTFGLSRGCQGPKSNTQAFGGAPGGGSVRTGQAVPPTYTPLYIAPTQQGKPACH